MQHQKLLKNLWTRKARLLPFLNIWCFCFFFFFSVLEFHFLQNFSVEAQTIFQITENLQRGTWETNYTLPLQRFLKILKGLLWSVIVNFKKEIVNFSKSWTTLLLQQLLYFGLFLIWKKICEYRNRIIEHLQRQNHRAQNELH